MVGRTLLVCLLLLLSVGFTGAQQTKKVTKMKESPKFYVWVQVSGDLEDETAGYVKRELKSFVDVKVASSSYWNYVLMITILEHTYKNGAKIGQISCSYLGLKLFDAAAFAWKFPKEYHVPIIEVTSNLFHYPSLHNLATGYERKDLKQLCQEIVESFDTELLEPDRQKR